NNGCAGSHTAGRSTRLRDGGRNIRTFVDIRQPMSGNMQFFKQRVRPVACFQIQQQGTGAVRDIGGKGAGQAISDVILGQQNVCDPGVMCRLVVSQPEDLGRLKTSERRVAGNTAQLGFADDGLNGFTGGAGALIVPENGRANDDTVVVQKNGTVH